MNLDYTPLLPAQRAIQGMPRTMERFQKYLDVMLKRDRTGVELPLVLMNPMGKDHVTSLLDELLAMNADGIAARAAAEVAEEYPEIEGDFKVAVMVVDDLLGGWTNRYATEMNLRFQPKPKNGKPRWLKDAWIYGVLWSSEPASERLVREAMRMAIHRFGYWQRHGHAKTLRQMMAQEGEVIARAGCRGPTLDDDDLEYTREVLQPFLDSEDTRMALECLFGDAASRTLGFTPQGLSPWAGLALALHDARAQTTIDISS